MVPVKIGKERTCSRNSTSDPMSSHVSCEEEILCHGTNSVTIVEHNFFAVDKKKNTVSFSMVAM
jgi:hypothetical protein